MKEKMIMETTFVMIKPDGVQRNLVGEIISRFEKKGLKIVGLKMLTLSREMAEELYDEHRDKYFFKYLTEFVTSGPVIVLALWGKGAIGMVRAMMGASEPLEFAPGTIRGDYSLDIRYNLIHSSSTEEEVLRELAILFPEGLITYDKSETEWLNLKSEEVSLE